MLSVVCVLGSKIVFVFGSSRNGFEPLFCFVGRRGGGDLPNWRSDKLSFKVRVGGTLVVCVLVYASFAVGFEVAVAPLLRVVLHLGV